MAKLLITFNDVLLKEVVLGEKDLIIGRGDKNCDVSLDDTSISRRHLLLRRGQRESFIAEDLGSRNGTLLNGKRIRCVALASGDVLTLGRFRLRYISETPVEDSAPQTAQPDKAGKTGFNLKTFLSAGITSEALAGDKTIVPPSTQQLSIGTWYISFLEGPRKGEIHALGDKIQTIGREGEQMAAITRQAEGYVIIHAGGTTRPLVNNQKVPPGGSRLQAGDVIQVGDHRVEVKVQG